MRRGSATFDGGRTVAPVGVATQHAALTSFLPALRSFARRLLRDPDEASDVVQQSALQALSAKNVPSNDRAYRAWLYRIARNAAVDVRRRRQLPARAVEHEDADPWLVERALISNLSVRQAMTRISPDHRRILLLVDVEELSYAETAGQLGVPVGTVMSRVARARAALLKALDPTGHSR